MKGTAIGSQSWSHLEQASDNIGQVLREMGGDSGAVAFDDLLVQAFHIVSMKRWLKCCHFI